MSYQDQEECDEQGHSSGNDFRFDQIGDPRDDDEHEARQVDLHQHLHRLAFDLHLKRWREITLYFIILLNAFWCLPTTGLMWRGHDLRHL